MSQGTDRDFAGDYGYDLAHELTTMIRVPAQRGGGGIPVSGLRALPFELDPDSDLGYDQAHDC